MQPKVEAFLSWWASATGDRPLDFVTDDVVYDTGIARWEGADALSYFAVRARFRDVRTLALFCAADQAALVFEGVDSATELSHRVSWLLEARGERFARILETCAVVPRRATEASLA